MRYLTKEAYDYGATVFSVLTALLFSTPAVIISIIQQEVLMVLVAAALVIISLISVAITYHTTLHSVVFMPERIRVYYRGKLVLDLRYTDCTLSYRGIGGIFRLTPCAAVICVSQGTAEERIVIPTTKASYAAMRDSSDKWGSVL